MVPAVTVIVPTHDHGAMLLRSVRSALRQTVDDIEVFIVGDGATEETRSAANQLVAEDARVRLFDNPKGQRLGEQHRHAALAEARGRIVCYLSDDDLWLPDHVESMAWRLTNADIANALPLRIGVDGSLEVVTLDLAVRFYRDFVLSGASRVPLSCTAHTLEYYHHLPFGWRPTPDTTSMALYYWQHLLCVPQVRAVSETRPTVLKFESPERAQWSTDQRIAEMDHWIARLTSPEQRDAFRMQVLDAVYRERASDEAIRFATLNWRIRRRMLGVWRRTFSWDRREQMKSVPIVGPLATRVAEALLGPIAR